MTNKKQTSSSVASKAAQVLKDPNASKIQKSLAACALAQANTAKQPTPEMEAKAGAALQSDKYSDLTKIFAGSIVSQSTNNS
ncbi:hypothetical protein DRM94_00985 [Aeromonas taiwanensis]|uniref:Uncharacterized protein n=1 Tax=Aeromonas taiwanensis TaxID=633417 RepID=A0A5F0KG50_9GAMM|nr:hypothetical protein [Aeromonas taiwanensis]TFF80774.1 hypothetical protein DRM93_00985 [Aeromonas taiwanensis]TFF81896.1 hypothetical protein DRM95_01750 [Aeromonas taiwanensis]TFF83299.1 hypothetical protein DRM94_00985 [Aeromonas taiwanensis]